MRVHQEKVIDCSCHGHVVSPLSRTNSRGNLPSQTPFFDIAFQKPTITQPLATVSVIVIATGLCCYVQSRDIAIARRIPIIYIRNSAKNKFFLNNDNSTKDFLRILEFFQHFHFIFRSNRSKNLTISRRELISPL